MWLKCCFSFSWTHKFIICKRRLVFIESARNELDTRLNIGRFRSVVPSFHLRITIEFLQCLCLSRAYGLRTVKRVLSFITRKFHSWNMISKYILENSSRSLLRISQARNKQNNCKIMQKMLQQSIWRSGSIHYTTNCCGSNNNYNNYNKDKENIGRNNFLNDLTLHS